MWISRKEMEQLSAAVKGYQNGQNTDIRDNKEGSFSILKNDIYAFAQSQSEQLTQAEAERDILAEYMADISHQLKTPITSMMIMMDLLEDAEPEKQQEFIQNIKFSLTKMEWLIGALLKMAKLDAKAITFAPQKVKVSELIQEVMPSIEILLDVNNQSVILEQDVEICCDKKWTIEALTNIVKNAMEHSPKEGTITIDSGVNPMYEWIAVTDSGSGLMKEQYAEIFKRFENSTNENGFGIGMPLALSIMKGQNGDIDVECGGNGKGATFLLKFFK
ncbi:MAG: HAMP domain-containing histidine kinase [Lachnospiraceae bacterium]|nr:HAMP domain-containing histidine kinase [Lachnospiraceae bacterium]